MALVFVGGSQRSGTTLLQTLLCRSPSTNPMIGEAKYLRQLVQAYGFGKRQFPGESADYFDDAEAMRAFHGGLLERFFAHVRSRFDGVQNLVLKEPHLTMLFPDIAELAPEARFVCVVRDPRDVIASMVEVGRKLAAQGIRDEPMARLFLGRDMAALSRHYLSFYLPALRSASASFMERSLFARYEDLVQSAQPVLDGIARLTGMDLSGVTAGDPGTGKVDFANVNGYRKAWATSLYGKKASESRIGAYAETLRPEEVAAVERHCAGIMKRFQYGAAAARAGDAAARNRKSA